MTKCTGISLYCIPFHERLNEENHKYGNISILARAVKKKETPHANMRSWLADERSCGAAGVISERFNVSAEIHNVAATV